MIDPGLGFKFLAIGLQMAVQVEMRRDETRQKEIGTRIGDRGPGKRIA